VLADLVSGLLERASGGVAANDLGVIATYRKQARAAAGGGTRGSAAGRLCSHCACFKTSHSVRRAAAGGRPDHAGHSKRARKL
jgi:hypothetical protein